MTLNKIQCVALIGLTALVSRADAMTVVTFDALPDTTTTPHGLVVQDQWNTAPFNLSIDVVNLTGPPHTAALFDSNFGGSTSDSDLLGPPWNGGNLDVDANNVQLGRLLYIEESGASFNPGDIIPNPDDEGSRPAGVLGLSFSEPITSFGFDLVDVEGPSEIWDPSDFDTNGNLIVGAEPTGFFAAFYTDGSPDPVAVVGFNELTDNTSPFYDPTIEFGNNSANRIAPFTLASLGLDGLVSGIDRVEIGLGGSGAIDNLAYDFPPPPPPSVVPLPSSAWMGAMALSGLFVVHGIRRRKAVAAAI